MKNILLSLALTLALMPSDGYAKPAPPKQRVELKHGSHRTGMRTDADMQQWRDSGLGQFIHWGVYAVPGGHWNGKVFGGAGEWIRVWNEIPHDVYDNFYKQFNPTEFDAAKWAKLAKEMGVKYMIFTTKHHDGFCMWPSKYTDYTIANSPYKKDIVKELVDAYTKEGIDVHLYFSIIDWNHKGYMSGTPKTPEQKAAYEEFKKFTRNQLFELLEKYPETKGLWFDGSWDASWKSEYAWVDQLGQDLRKAKPGLIIGSRFRADENGKRHYDTNGDLIDDYDQTWERDLPETYDQVKGVDWDCCMTVPENGWGYHATWLTYAKNSYDLIDMIMHANSMDGNFVLNFGPDAKGNIRPEETKLAKEIGAWMKVNGEAVYGAHHANLKPQGWGYYTQKEGKTYLSVFNRPIDNRVKVVLPGSKGAPEKAYLLDGKTPLEILPGGKNKRNENIYYIAIPQDYKTDKPFVIVLEGEIKGSNKGKYQQALT
ncbi:alpha-L-fucosidase [Akkermansia sp. N21116]|jgi:alpha-L-fucosidase|uniref:alpha-L-fucosidase n=1 Tax=Akkermansia sp. N21116 TaxID=3040764 RepID=UPI00244EB03E|nr:alpha-L-fucosidase [Akkermansia sp. N21116]WPX40778.1 alpha-L-fucosidase [Akkermansia sp. N21116]